MSPAPRRGFRRDASGSVALIFALALPVLIGAAAVATDIGSVYLARRDLQAATDAAALAAVARPAEAEAVARRMLDANGFAAASFTLRLGRHVETASPHSEATMRPGEGTDAVRIEARYVQKAFLAPIFSHQRFELSARSEAALRPTVSLSAGSRLAAVDPGLVNAVLKPLLGLDLALSVADYDALLQAKVGLGDLLKRLPGGTAGSPVGEVLARSLSASALFQALSVEMDLQGRPAAGAVLRKLAQRSLRLKADLSLGALVSVDPALNGLGLAYPGPGLQAGISVLDLVNAAIGRREGGQTASLSLPLPGLAAVDLDLLVGEGLQSARALSVGPGAPAIETAQLRLRAKVATSGAPDLLGVGLTLPLEVVLAGGRAEVASATCSPDPAQRSVRLRVRPGAAKLAIGTWSGPLASANVIDRLPAATLLSLPAVRIQAEGLLALREPAPVELVFTGAEIARGTVKIVRTRSLAESLVGTLLSETDVTVQLGGLGLSLGGLTKSVAGVLAGLAKPLDDLIQAVAATAGVSLGEMHVRVDDVVCGPARIVG